MADEQAFARDTNFATGPYTGDPCKVPTPSGLQASGFRPGEPIGIEYLNYELNRRPSSVERPYLVMLPDIGETLQEASPTGEIVQSGHWTVGFVSGDHAYPRYFQLDQDIPSGATWVIKVSMVISNEYQNPNGTEGGADFRAELVRDEDGSATWSRPTQEIIDFDSGGSSGLVIRREFVVYFRLLGPVASDDLRFHPSITLQTEAGAMGDPAPPSTQAIRFEIQRVF